MSACVFVKVVLSGVFYVVNDMLSENETRNAQTTDKRGKASNALLA